MGGGNRIEISIHIIAREEVGGVRMRHYRRKKEKTPLIGLKRSRKDFSEVISFAHKEEGDGYAGRRHWRDCALEMGNLKLTKQCFIMCNIYYVDVMKSI